MVEYRLLWKEKVPGLLVMQTFAAGVTTDFAASHAELVARRAAQGYYSLFIEARKASVDPWPALGEGSIPPRGKPFSVPTVSAFAENGPNPFCGRKAP